MTNTPVQVPFVLSLGSCGDPALCGGKGAGLAALVQQGFHVPPGFCLTTAAYLDSLKQAGIDHEREWSRIRATDASARQGLLSRIQDTLTRLMIPESIRADLDAQLNGLEQRLATGAGTRWAVRSSASCEDTWERSYAGIYRTVLSVPSKSVPSAVSEVWASLWTETAFGYLPSDGESGVVHMAVVVQPLVRARVAGAAFSCHPVSGRTDDVVINAALGLAEPLVGGLIRPDEFTVRFDAGSDAVAIHARAIAEKTWRRVPAEVTLCDEPVPLCQRYEPVLQDDEIIEVARLAKQVERAAGHPVDVEWAIDEEGLWLLQARPMSRVPVVPDLKRGVCVWSRANFKETMPEVPSPLGLSFLTNFMARYFLRHYVDLGCRIPPGMSSVRVFLGRPYINVTLFQSLSAQLGGDPRLITEQMGGEADPVPPQTRRLPWWRLLKAGLLAEWKIFRGARRAPAWFVELQRMGEAQQQPALDALTEVELMGRLEELGKRVEGDLTFAIMAGLSQALQALRSVLARRTPQWRALLNAATQGTGGIVSADQILQLIRLAEMARGDREVRDLLLADVPIETARTALAGTEFVAELDRYFSEYGHRALGESDVMSPRFAETPDYVLNVIKGHLTADRTRPVEAIRSDQEATRQAAVRHIRKVFGRRVHEWVWFHRWYRSMAKYLALREANRHAVMHYATAVRRILLALGERLRAGEAIETPGDIFFFTHEELRSVVLDGRPHWKAVVASRRAAWERFRSQTAPDTIVTGAAYQQDVYGLNTPRQDARTLPGIGISAGYAEGPARVIRSADDLGKIAKGEVLVVPVIDPGMAPLLGLASGLVIEMGGMLSHGAIIAREYGIPAVANVAGATRLLKDGERVAVDATRGEIVLMHR